MSQSTTVPPARRFFSVRFTPVVFLLLAGYFCVSAGYDDTLPGRIATNFQVKVWMFFFFSWVFAAAAFLLALYQLVRYRSVQQLVEISLAIWLLVWAVGGALRAA